MSVFRLYRDFIKVTHNNISNSDTNVMITPYGLSAYTSGSTSIVEVLTPINDITGRYYVELDLSKYNYTIINSLIWQVIYDSDFNNINNVKNLITRFRILPKILIGTDISIETQDNSCLDVEIQDYIYEVEIL